MPAADAYLDDVRLQFRKLKKLAEDALAQVKDEELNVTLDAESNSLAVIMKHMAGNLRSRFTDFLTTDGEKPDRNRDGEFEIEGQPGPRHDLHGLGERLDAALRDAERADACRPAQGRARSR